MAESDTSVESIDNVPSVSTPAEFSINLLSKNRRKRRKTSHIAQISARQMVEQLKNPDLYADGEILNCRVCEKSLDHRKGAITRHFKSEFHIGNKIGNENSKKTDAQKSTSSQNLGKTRKQFLTSWKSLRQQIFRSTLKTTLTSDIISRKKFEDTSRLKVFLKSHYKTLVFRSHFFVLRARPLLSKRAQNSWRMSSRNVWFNHRNIYEFRKTTEAKLVKTSSQSAEKFYKYFHETSGIHPAKILREISYFYPVTALGFSEIPRFCQINRFSQILKSELQHYRQKERTFISKCEDLFDVEAIEEENQAVRDFWNSNRMILPNLFDIVRQNAYLVGSSAGVERAFIKQNFERRMAQVDWKTPENSFSCILMVLNSKDSWKITVFHEMFFFREI